VEVASTTFADIIEDISNSAIFTTKFTTKKHRKQEDSLETLGNNNLLDTSVYKGLMLNYGIIWDRIE